MNEVQGKKIVQNIVDMWSKVYINQVFFINKMGNVWCYEVEFSKPKNMKPIPEGTVKVFFTVMETADAGTDVEFNFENESLKHREGNTMRTAKYEVSSLLAFTFNPYFLIGLDRLCSRKEIKNQEVITSWQ